MRKVEVQIEIDAPAQQVWEVLADFGGVYRWAPSVTNSYSTSENSRGPEASRHRDIVGLGGIDEYITEWNEGWDFTYRFAGVGLMSEGSTTWSVKPQDDKTLVHTDMRYRVRLGPRDFLMALFLRRNLQRGLEKGLERGLAGLKHHVETGELIGVDFCIPVAA